MRRTVGERSAFSPPRDGVKQIREFHLASSNSVTRADSTSHYQLFSYLRRLPDSHNVMSMFLAHFRHPRYITFISLYYIGAFGNFYCKVKLISFSANDWPFFNNFLPSFFMTSFCFPQHSTSINDGDYCGFW